jgi:DNA-binding NarL/FixJ family response regulator
MAISWLETPMAWTYVSLFTLPKSTSPLVNHRAGNRLRLALIEPDSVFRAALIHWLGRIPGATCVGWATEELWFSQPTRRSELDVLLVNRYAPAFVAGRFKPSRADPALGPLVFGYGIYPTSDDIFASVSGVEAGYFLRRRTLSALLEPLSAAFTSGQLDAAEVPRTLRRYFQNLFTVESETATAGGLTTRERQILACIQRGLRDKEIATSLGISPLTVHTHLKHVFHKLGAHTRTEAVVKFLEK